MDPELTPEQRAFQAAVRDVARDVVAPAARARRGEDPVPLEIVRRIADLGLFGLPFPSTYGGLDGDLLTFCICLEELGWADASVAIMLSRAVGLAANAVFRLGDEAQRRRWLTPLARGLAIGAFALSADEGVLTIAARTRREGDGWVIDGPPIRAVNADAPLSSLCVVPTRDEATARTRVFLVPIGTPGLDLRLGASGSDREVALEGCRVPADHALGEGGDAIEGLLGVVAEARVTDAAVATGTAVAAGKPTEAVDALRSAHRRAARLRDQGRPFRDAAAVSQRLSGRLWGP